MASTYSSLKIELIGTGDQAGTWGNTTNTNLGTAIEEAITGSANVTFASANVTLTLTDTNATQTARNLRLNLTGTSGGARDLIVPAIEKLYVVNNGLADTITVKNSTGTGVAVPAGKTMFVFNDATNVVDVTTYLSSLTLGAALPVASGGTGQTTYTDGQLLIGNSTGNTLTKSTLTAGAGVTISNSGGNITIAATGTSNGTVTAINIASANGFAGTATGNVTSNITLSTTVTGVLKGNGTAISAAVAGTDYAPATTGTAILKGNNAGGFANAVAGTDYAPATSGTSILYGNNAGGFSNVVVGSGLTFSGNTLSTANNYVMTVFTSPGTWTKPAGLKAVKVTVVGGGGAGGVGSNGKTGSGGGGGGAAIRYIPAPTLPGPQPVTRGAGGAANPAAGGGTSSFGTFASATGGAAGSTSPTPTYSGGNGGAGGVGSSGDLNIEGGGGGAGFICLSVPTPSPAITSIVGFGGSSILGGGAISKIAPAPYPTAGDAGGLYGGGGSGGAGPQTGPGTTLGGAGANGVIIVEEFY